MVYILFCPTLGNNNLIIGLNYYMLDLFVSIFYNFAKYSHSPKLFALNHAKQRIKHLSYFY